ncbi:FDXHR family putative zinc-binding protein [Parafrankia elaeagni]
MAPHRRAGVAHCAGCHLTFTSTHSFDQHRTGHSDHRRCLTHDELTAAGWSANEYDRWRIPWTRTPPPASPAFRNPPTDRTPRPHESNTRSTRTTRPRVAPPGMT